MKIVKWVRGLWRFGLVAILAALAGAFLAAMFMPGMAAPSGWADVMTALVSFLGLAIAVAAFFRWKQNKIRDDAYSAVKLYVESVVEMEFAVVSVMERVGRILIVPGSLVPSKHEASNVIASVRDSLDELNVKYKHVAIRYLELTFWGVSLVDEAKQTHEELCRLVHRWGSEIGAVALSAENYYILGIDSEKSSLIHFSSSVVDRETELVMLFGGRRVQKMQNIYKHHADR